MTSLRHHLPVSEAVPAFDHLFIKKCLLISSLNLPQHSFEPFLLITGSPGEEIAILSSYPPQETVESNEVTPQPPFLQTRPAQNPWGSSQDILSKPFTTFVALLWMRSRTFTSKPWGPELHTAPEVRPHQGWTQQDNHLLIDNHLLCSAG